MSDGDPGAEDPGAETKVCPDCAETIKAQARVCRYCGFRFEPAPTRTNERIQAVKEQITPVAAKATERAGSAADEALDRVLDKRVGGLSDALTVGKEFEEKEFNRKIKEARKWLREQKAPSAMPHKAMLGYLAQLARSEAEPLFAAAAVLAKDPTQRKKKWEIHIGMLVVTNKGVFFLRQRPGLLTSVGLTTVVKMEQFRFDQVAAVGAQPYFRRGYLLVDLKDGQRFLWSDVKPKDRAVLLADVIAERTGAERLDEDAVIRAVREAPDHESVKAPSETQPEVTSPNE